MDKQATRKSPFALTSSIRAYLVRAWNQLAHYKAGKCPCCSMEAMVPIGEQLDCGHPSACLRSNGDSNQTAYCAWCKDAQRVACTVKNDDAMYHDNNEVYL